MLQMMLRIMMWRIMLLRTARGPQRYLWRRNTRRRSTNVRPIVVASVLSGLAGATLEYLLDPERGRRRRAIAQQRVAATVRGSFRRANRAARWTGSQAYGLSQRVRNLRSADPAPPNDVTLARRVESEAFRDSDVPKGRVNVNVEHGVVVLRGELDRPEQINTLEAAVRRVPGVRDVNNLLHLPGTPPPAAPGGDGAGQETG